MPAWWALWLPWWPPAGCYNASMYLLIDIDHEFLLLFYCFVLLEIKLTTTIKLISLHRYCSYSIKYLINTHCITKCVKTNEWNLQPCHKSYNTQCSASASTAEWCTLSAIITCPIYHSITYDMAMTTTERKSDFKLTTDTPYLTLMGCLFWGFQRKLTAL